MKKLTYWLLRITFNIFLIPIMLVSSSKNSNGELTIRPSLNVGEVYTSNSTDSADNEDKKWDLISSVAPGISLSHSSRIAAISSGYSLNSKFYHKNPELSYLGHNGNFRMNKELSQSISINLNDSIGYTKSSGELPQEETTLFSSDAMGLKTKSTGRLTNNASISANLKLSQTATMVFGVSENMLFLEDDDLIDTRTDILYFSWDKQFSINTVNMGYDYSTYSYDMYDYSFDTESNSLENHSVHLGFVNSFTENTSLELSGGCTYTPSPDPVLNWSGKGGFTKKMQSSSIRAYYSRAVSNSGGLSKEININQTVLGGWSINAGKHVGISITASGSENVSKPSEDIKITSYTAGTDISWNIRPWITTSAGYSHFQQWAEKLGGENFSRDQISINLTIMPEGWKF